MNNNNSFAVKLEQRLKPLYERLISDVSHLNREKYTFAVQWGKHFPHKQKDGFIFVGRATNGWGEESKDIDIDTLFGETNDSATIFNCDDQMTWVEVDKNGYQKGPASKASAFWRVIRAVACHFYPVDYINYIAWSNVCKIQYDDKKNPTGRLYDSQIDTCKEIFKTELDVLSPKFIIMFTGGYGESDMLSFLNGGEMPSAIDSANWGEYNVDVYAIGDMYFFCTEHPQGKAEQSHIDCLIELINKYK